MGAWVSETVLDRVIASLRDALSYDKNARVTPVALLWPDEGGQWESVIGRIAERMPLVSLGDYDPEARRGPAYWIRCVVAGTVDIGLPDGRPIVYLPGVGRAAMRAADGCPSELAPIAELQYRSQWFSHPNHRDWTIRALLSHERGLGLQIADDAETRSALSLALERLVDERIDRLRTQVLDVDYLLELVNEDPAWSILRWLDDPQSHRTGSDPDRWRAFVQQCKADYDIDPITDGEISAARALGSRQGKWANVWTRFADTPERYPGIIEQLRKARPEELIINHVDSWPQDNEIAEDQLRSRLREFATLTPECARDEVVRLDDVHGRRRGTVWAKLDRAPLAFAIEQLRELGELTAQPLAANDVDSLVADYTERGWRVDDALLRALGATAHGVDREAVTAAAGALYGHWLDLAAKALQALVGPLANADTYSAEPPASASVGTATVFVDGLRLDVSRRLETRLADAGLIVSGNTGLAALPTVTQTAKPALVPAAKEALGAGPGLYPAEVETGTKASIKVLRKLMTDGGVQILGPAETGDPSGAAWVEVGEIDRRGHDVGSRIVDYLDDEVDRVAGRIRELLEAGWGRVEVITDHGWVLLPGGMEKVELPPATAELKKGRCARLKDGAMVEAPTVPWFWDPDVRIALAPGATCFEANQEYEHGGVSPQECIVPRITVTAGTDPTTGGAEITKVKWLGLNCRVEFNGVTERVAIDIRGLPAEPKSSIVERSKETAAAGKVSLMVPDDDHEGERAYVVLIAPGGQILAQREVVVGRNR